ncbi:MAG: hypothetical protein L0H15_01965 [Nitrosospira sp.]|nr:hypothetical protein [Nitrosospira sp.]
MEITLQLDPDIDCRLNQLVEQYGHNRDDLLDCLKRLLVLPHALKSYATLLSFV